MSLTVYIVSAVSVFFFSGLMAMAGLGAAFIFVPLFYYLGVPLAEAVPTALLLNVVSLMFAAANYYRGGLINWRIGLPILDHGGPAGPPGSSHDALCGSASFPRHVRRFSGFRGVHDALLQGEPRTKALSRAIDPAPGRRSALWPGFWVGCWAWAAGISSYPFSTGLGIDAKVAAGTTAMVVVFASLSGFLGHVTLGGLSPVFLGVMAVMSALGSIVGSHMMKTKISSAQLKKIIGVLLWLIAAKMIFDIVK